MSGIVWKSFWTHKGDCSDAFLALKRIAVMSDKTGIAWTNATWNPVTGCTKVSQGCKYCYAEREWGRLSANPKATTYHGRAFTDVACHPERLDQPLRWKKPRMIFVNSMSDLFHEDVPDAFIDKVFAVMALAEKHTFQVLTKRPERMREYLHHPDRYDLIGMTAMPLVDTGSFGLLEWPLPNVWLGVSVEDQATRRRAYSVAVAGARRRALDQCGAVTEQNRSNASGAGPVQLLQRSDR